MPLNAIEITVETIELPGNWMPASEAREIATSVSNKNTKNFLNNIMAYIKNASEDGRTKISIACVSANNEVYERGVEILKSLGYSVSGHPRQGENIIISW